MSNQKSFKKALITGITGQDGSYLAELLLKKGYEAHGLIRRVAAENQSTRFSRINHLMDKLILHHGDITNYPTIFRLVAKVRPDEIYHLAAVSQVPVSFEDSFGVFQQNTYSTHYLLSAIQDLYPQCRFYFAGSSEMFGRVSTSPQNEKTPFNPSSPYAISKVASYHLTKLYRDAHGIFGCTGIFFNHESPRRGFDFVTRKITTAAARIKLGLQKELRLGNLEAKRDWGFAGDYVEAMWLMLQQDKPDDYVVGTGKNYKVKDFLEAAFGYVGLDWRKHVIIDEKFIRPLEVPALVADYSKAKSVLGWEPKITFEDLVKMMVDNDLKIEKKNL